MALAGFTGRINHAGLLGEAIKINDIAARNAEDFAAEGHEFFW